MRVAHICPLPASYVGETGRKLKKKLEEHGKLSHRLNLLHQPQQNMLGLLVTELNGAVCLQETIYIIPDTSLDRVRECLLSIV